MGVAVDGILIRNFPAPQSRAVSRNKNLQGVKSDPLRTPFGSMHYRCNG